MLIDITPIMTSNTTPTPYVVSVSALHSSSYAGWKVFNGTNNDPYDAWAFTGQQGWITLDFATETRLDAFSITAKKGSSGKALPKDFTLYGSLDGEVYDEVLVVENQTGWVSEEKRTFVFYPKFYRYYKLEISSNNGATWTDIGELRFLQNDFMPDTEYVSNRKSSLNYCLPKNSTLAMQQREYDPREGLLGFANDPDNRYGTLYMIDDKGKAIIPKASMAEPDVLFEGVANDTKITYSLNKSISDYSVILVIGNCTAGTIQQNISSYLPVSYIQSTFGTGASLFALILSYGSARRLFWSFIDDNNFSIDAIENGMRIVQILGYH